MKKGLSECRRRFRWERWNCSFSKKITSKILKRKFLPEVTKEIAYMNAITSASVALRLATACHKGEISRCCTAPLRKAFKRKLTDKKEAEDEHTRFGLWITEYFTDFKIKPKKYIMDKAVAIRHNNKIGRNVVKHMAKRFCRCHGTSGMCSLKTCAGHLPTLKQVGTTIRYLYKLAYKGKVVKNFMLRPTVSRNAVDLTDVLVYLSESPDYCKVNQSHGSQGTIGRACRIPVRDSTRGSKGHCNELCYSCGFSIRYEVRPKKVRCNCKFRWCCEVRCETCRYDEDVLVCHVPKKGR
ncbi:protein Wnt-8-like [Rhopilema esculentum]|uniref:protein Wnt-8-like n=1 Tax=Rhopilema esculentum TaxID=499914 RepID=UPI0031D0B116